MVTKKEDKVKTISHSKYFDGISSNENQVEIGNISINNKLLDPYNIFCADKNTGKIYYSNYNDNNYLYKLSGNESTLLAKIKANYINVMNGKIYFISKEGNINEWESTGNIYVYDIATKECNVFIETKARTLLATKEGLYYYVRQDEKSIMYFYNFDTNQTTETKEFQKEFDYKDYKMLYINDKRCYTNGEKEIPFTDDGSIIVNATVYNGNFISYRDGITIINLKSGEMTHIPLSKIMENEDVETALFDFTVVDNYLYVCCYWQWFFKIDMDTYEITRIVYEGTDPENIIPFHDNALNIKKLYTDEKDIYALCEDYDKNVKFCKFEINGQFYTMEEIR